MAEAINLTKYFVTSPRPNQKDANDNDLLACSSEAQALNVQQSAAKNNPGKVIAIYKLDGTLQDPPAGEKQPEPA